MAKARNTKVIGTQRDDLDLEFERRMQARHARLKERAQRLEAQGRRWRCVECGEEYGPAWVLYYGPVCHVECDGLLEEVRA